MEAHLETCEACAAEVEALRETADALERAATEGRRPPEELRETDLTASATNSSSSSLRAAAVIAALLVGGVAAADAALPGHPIRLWLGEAVEAVTGAGEPAADRPARGGLSVAPEAGALRVRITGAPDGTPVMVRFTDEPRASVSARGGTFRTGSGLLELDAPARGEVRVRVPRSASALRVTANGRVLVEKASGRLTVPGAGPDSTPPVLRFSVEGGGR